MKMDEKIDRVTGRLQCGMVLLHAATEVQLRHPREPAVGHSPDMCIFTCAAWMKEGKHCYTNIRIDIRVR
jgi:hypothetical protein